MSTPICPNCGSLARPESAYCRNCGEQLHEPPAIDRGDLIRRLDSIEERVSMIEAQLNLQEMARPHVVSHVARVIPPATVERPSPTEVSVPAPTEPVRPALPPSATVPPPEPETIPPPKPSFDLKGYLAERWLAVVGGLALLVGAIFFLSLAFSNGWISPPLRVALGLVAGLAMLAGGYRLFDRKQRITGHALVAAGAGIASLSLIASHRLYDLTPLAFAMLGLMLVGGITAAIAIRFRLQIVAVYGIAAVLLGPVLLDAQADTATIAMIGLTLIAGTAIAVATGWNWLPIVSFVVVAPQLAFWISDQPNQYLAVVVVVLFWLLTVLGALNRRLLVVDVPFSRWSFALFVTAGPICRMGLFYDGADMSPWLFTLPFAVGYLLIGWWLLARRPGEVVFAETAIFMGLGFVTLGMAQALDGNALAVGLAVQMVVTHAAWQRTRIRSVAIWAFIYGVAAGAVCLANAREFVEAESGKDAFGLSPLLVTVGLLVVAYGVIAGMSRIAWVRRLALAAAGIAVCFAAVQALDDWWLIVAWTAIASGLLHAARHIWFRPLHVEGDIHSAYGINMLTGQILSRVGTIAPPAVAFAALAGAFAVWLDALEQVGVPPGNRLRDIPFLDVGTATGLIFVAAFLAERLAARSATIRAVWTTLALAVVSIVAVVEPENSGRVVAFALLALIPLILARLEPLARSIYLTVAGALGSAATAVALVLVIPPERLDIDGVVADPVIPFFNWGTLALLAIAGVLIYAALTIGGRPGRWAGFTAAIVLLYALSVGIVDVFQRLVTNPEDVSSAGRQAQVALSIAWAVIGFVALVFGGRRESLDIRKAGLALLLLATIKVFVLDLATLNTTYRVLSFIGLGAVLILASFIYRSVASDDAEQTD